MERTVLKTNGLCFICLESVTSENNFISLKRILHHLSISNSVEVEMCESCKKISGRLSILLLTLEKIQMEINYYLNQTHERIVKSANNLQLVQRYSSRMTSDAESLCQLVQVDKLRKELSIKCQIDLHGPELKLTRIGSTKRAVIKAKPEEDSEDCEGPEDSSSPSPSFDFQPISPSPPISPEVDNFKTEVASSPVKELKDSRSLHMQNVFLDNLQKAGLEKHQRKKTAPRKTSNMQEVLVKAEEAEESSEVASSTSKKYTIRCQICKRLCWDSRGLSLHLARYHTSPEEREAAINKALSCTICDKTLLTYDGLKIHEKSHIGNRPFLCEFCPKSFSQNSLLLRHVRQFHTKLEELTVEKTVDGLGALVTCTICFKQFQNKLYLDEHLIRVHRPFVKTPKFQCDTCGAAFTQKKSLENHIFLLHFRGSEQKPRKKPRKYFQCEICKRMISDSRRNLKVHMRTHTGEKPYKCDLCGMAFSIAGSLRDHKACKHSDVTLPSVCGLCGKSFIRPYLLDYHKHKFHNFSKEDGTLPSVTSSLFKSS